ncbi:MAG: glycosyltransferase, partial [Candidatus Omnitrophica bacterium]|nr:glycosyltransferase [Candidatus Omnitrophota bacterium]
MTVSIIIAVKTWQENLERCVKACQELDYSDFEIIILPDQKQFPTQSGNCFASNRESGIKGVSLSIIPTGPVSPGRKRDIALSYAKGEILAFIDDDAYPRKDWLKKAQENFSDPQVAAVGGPAITPSSDNLRQRASGIIFASYLVSGPYRYRYVPVKRRQVDDYPTCNFLVRKSIMQQAGGFATNFWPGEDTKLCLKITKKLNKKIIYDPEVVVYHHRRPLFLPHLKQVANYALHRGYFA